MLQESEQERQARSNEDRNVREPLYLKVAEQIRKDVVDGTYPVGTLLPSEEDLRTKFLVSRHTIREALRKLRSDGLISSRKGAGSIVIPVPASNTYVPEGTSLQDLLAVAADMHLDVEFAKMVKVNDKLAAETGIASGEDWLSIGGPGYCDGQADPVCWAEYYINKRFSSIGRLFNGQSGPVFPFIEAMFGERVEQVQQKISATLIVPTLASKLKVAPRSAALHVVRKFVLSTGEIAQVTITIYPSSRYSYFTTIGRAKM